jgi:hypothetical protein
VDKERKKKKSRTKRKRKKRREMKMTVREIVKSAGISKSSDPLFFSRLVDSGLSGSFDWLVFINDL